MVKFLSQEWLERQHDLAQSYPETPGATALVQYRITDGPDGTVDYWVDIEDGHLRVSELGANDDADFTMIIAYEEFVLINSDELDYTTAFMQGRLKVEGDMGKLMSLLPLTNGEDFKAIGRALVTETEF